MEDLDKTLLHALLWAITDPHGAASVVKLDVVREYLRANGWECLDTRTHRGELAERWERRRAHVRGFWLSPNTYDVLSAAQVCSWDEERSRADGPGHVLVLAWWVFLSTRPPKPADSRRPPSHSPERSKERKQRQRFRAREGRYKDIPAGVSWEEYQASLQGAESSTRAAKTPLRSHWWLRMQTIVPEEDVFSRGEGDLMTKTTATEPRTARPTLEEIAAHAKAHPLPGDFDEAPGTPHGGAWWVVATVDRIAPCGMMVELIPSESHVEWVELSMHPTAERGDFSFFTGRFPGREEFKFYALDRYGNIVPRPA